MITDRRIGPHRVLIPWMTLGFFMAWLALTLNAAPAASDVPVVAGIDAQPLMAEARRLIEAMDYLGDPLDPSEQKKFQRAQETQDPAAAVRTIQTLLDHRCLFFVDISPEMRVDVSQAAAAPVLDEKGWRIFLVKVRNQAGTTTRLRVESPNARALAGSPASDIANRWLDAAMFNKPPLKKTLSGLGLEYRIIELYSRDAGKREARFSFNVGQGTQDIGFRNLADVLFTCRPANAVVLHVRDENNRPTTASFVIRDAQGRIYPSPAKRLAPDFAFQPQIYRADGETIRLPAGTYDIEFSRGPESIPRHSHVTIGPGVRELSFKVKRWIDPSLYGWWSGDHHIHAAGCAHYARPTQGVGPADMMRHCLGEDLKVGCTLTWGPCFDYQKQFFTGHVDKVSQYPYLLRYDIEVSGFGSHQSGHLVLLRLKNDIYPGGTSDKHWPTLGLNTLRWAKSQGAVCGAAHSGWGLEVQTSKLPNFVIPPYNGIGANEYIVDVTHNLPGPDGRMEPAVDFMSAEDTPYVWELNMWYHTLNCGFRTRLSGETDFPCIYGERVGIGRSYVREKGRLNFDDWCEGIREGRCYVSDGKSHLMDFAVNGLAVGDRGSELRLGQPATVHVTAKVAAWLNQRPDPKLQHRPYTEKPYWDIERARIGNSREVPIEVVVNAYPVARKRILADGRVRDISFDIPIRRSSWIALRILPSSHTNPIFVLVNDKPIRASRRSAEWCLKGVDQCWSQKQRFIKPAEMKQAQEAYDHARQVYRKILSECDVD